MTTGDEPGSLTIRRARILVFAQRVAEALVTCVDPEDRDAVKKRFERVLQRVDGPDYPDSLKLPPETDLLMLFGNRFLKVVAS